LLQFAWIILPGSLVVIIIGIGANLPGPGHADPRATCEAALACLPARGIVIDAISPWYESEPVPRSDQPWFLNAVLRVTTTHSPGDLLAGLHDVEKLFGRERGAPNAARALDLDLLDHDGAVSPAGGWPILPHPRMHARAFVLLPLRDLFPAWVHPRLDTSIESLIADLPVDQEIRRQND
jgi:2-amino-4-hydroxy-6-hydroxymethyldihydropteridine diphosphokinase